MPSVRSAHKTACLTPWRGPKVDTPCPQLFLDEAAQRHADDNIVMVREGAGWHTNNDLREKHFHNRVIDSPDAAEDHPVIIEAQALRVGRARGGDMERFA